MRSFNKHQGSLELHRVAALRRQRVDCNEVRRLALHGFYGTRRAAAGFQRVPPHPAAPSSSAVDLADRRPRAAPRYIKTSYAAALSDSPKDV